MLVLDIATVLIGLPCGLLLEKARRRAVLAGRSGLHLGATELVAGALALAGARAGAVGRARAAWLLAACGAARLARRFVAVGLTGGIACGKSTASAELRRGGLSVIDADEIAREVVEPGERAHAAIARRFGAAVLRADGGLDRDALGRLVFGDSAAARARRKALNAITHPAVGRRVLWRLLAARVGRGERAVALDVPLLLETPPLAFLCSPIVVVALDDDAQLARLVARDPGLDADAARRRIASQMPTRLKVQRADAVLENSSTKAALTAQVASLVSKLRELA